MTGPLDYRDLEGPAYDVVDMARLVSYVVHELFEERPKNGVYRFTAYEADMALFVSRLMVEKASSVLEKFNEIHASTSRPVRVVGGERDG